MCRKYFVPAIYVLVLFLIFCAESATQDTTNIITLPNGKIRGHQLVTRNGNNYYAFQEIPYASPPVGNLRFKKSVPPKPWTGVLDTKENTKICYQFIGCSNETSIEDERENEDCLYLNVYTPLEPGKTDELLPVFFWIHGGCFVQGDGTFKTFGPQFFIDQNIILVSIGYRLGPFGFLTTDDGVIEGNLGLKDQHLALEWVKENIILFGGDPTKVTIGGQSAGASSAGYHLLNKKSKDLYRAAIMESGSPLCPKMLQRHPRYYAFQLGAALSEHFNFKNTSEDLLNLLTNTPAVEIKCKNKDIYMPIDKRNCVGDEGNTIWVPVIENNSKDPIVAGLTHEKLKNGNINLVPIIIGFTSEEELSFDLDLLRTHAAAFDKNVSLLVNGNLNIRYQNKHAAGAAIKNIYTDGLFKDDFKSLVKFISDAKYTTGTSRHAELQSRYSNVYFYQFSYEGVLGQSATVPGLHGVGHGKELNYLFSNKQSEDISKYPEADVKTHLRLLRLWTNFVKYLNPTPYEDSLLNNVTWPAISHNILHYLNIDKVLKIKRNPRQYGKWKEIYQKYADEELASY